MTEREIIRDILKRIHLKINYEDSRSIEFENGYGHEDINIDLDENDNVIDIGC